MRADHSGHLLEMFNISGLQDAMYHGRDGVVIASNEEWRLRSCACNKSCAFRRTMRMRSSYQFGRLTIASVPAERTTR